MNREWPLIMYSVHSIFDGFEKCGGREGEGGHRFQVPYCIPNAIMTSVYDVNY